MMLNLTKIKNKFQTNGKSIILGIIISFMSFFVVKFTINEWVLKRSNKYEKERELYKDSIRTYKDKAGDVVQKIYEKKIYLNETSEAEKKQIDSLSKILLIKNKEISKYIEIISRTDLSKSTGKIDSISYIDSSYPVYMYSYEGRFLQYQALASKDSLHFNRFDLKDSLYIVQTTKKFNKKTYNELVLKNLNPDVNIEGFKSISYEVPKEYSPWSIGITGGFDPINMKPGITIGLSRSLIRFKKKIK